MIDERWMWVERIFHEAIELPAREREPFLLVACASDPERIPEVSALIAAFEKDAGFLESAGFGAGLAVLSAQTVPPASLAGTLIGQYEVGWKIGEGGMGEVYDALDTKLNRRVALKFLANPFIDNNIAKRQLIREAQSAAMLNHTNICSIYDIEQIGQQDFIAMEYIAGMTLAEAIKTGQIDHEQLPRIIKQIVEAAAFAHSHGVVHRDLKPANIMIDPEADGKITVLDFGLAKLVKPVGGLEGHSVASQSGLIIGTVSYMSPEQLRGERLDYQSDIFSIGVTLYELIAGKNPFARESQADTIAAVLGDEPPRLTAVDSRISTDMSDIVAKCMERDKQKRFQSTAEILVAIENATDRRKRVRKPLGRLQMGTAAILFLMIVATVIGFLFVRAKASSIHSLAVLPFTVANPKPEYDYLADGIPRSISEQLSNLPEIRVKDESFRKELHNVEVDAQAIGRELGVEAVLTGKIVARGDGLILLTNLVRTLDGVIIDNGEQKIDEMDLIGLQQVVSERVADKLSSGITLADKEKLAARNTLSREAKLEYLRGRQAFEMQPKEGLKRAIGHFEKAVNIDSTYARAWAGLATAYAEFSVPGHKGEIDPKTAAEKAAFAANQAMEIDDTLAEPLVALGMVKIRYHWDWDAAEALLEKAIKRDPNFTLAHTGLSNLLVLRNRYDESLAEARKAKEVSPIWVLPNLAIARALYFQGDFQALDRHLDEALESFPNHSRLNYFRSLGYIATGKNKEAAKILEVTYREDQVYGAAPLALAYSRIGRQDKALKILEDLEIYAQNPQSDFVSGQEFAIIYLGLGETDKVFENLNKACTERFAPFPFVITDPIFTEIRSDARFEGLKRCANL